MKNVTSLIKSAVPRTMNIVQDGCRFKLQKRDYGAISDASWKSAVEDTMWLSKKNTYQICDSRLMHFIPSFDGCPGIPFQNEINRYSYNKPNDFVNLPKKTSYNIAQHRLEDYKNLLMRITVSDLKTKQQYILKPKNVSKAPYHINDCEKALTTSMGVDDEALFFSTNFVIMTFLFLVVVLLRDI